MLYNKDEKKIIEGFNSIELAKKDSKYKSMAKATNEMVTGKSGTVEYRLDGKKMYAVYHPVEGHDSWFIVMNAPKIEFTSTMFISILVSAILAVVLKASIDKIVEFLNEILSQINLSAEQVVTGAQSTCCSK